jgi:hypothetical protein
MGVMLDRLLYGRPKKRASLVKVCKAAQCPRTSYRIVTAEHIEAAKMGMSNILNK